jgi:hypothetical protein
MATPWRLWPFFKDCEAFSAIFGIANDAKEIIMLRRNILRLAR